MPSNIDLATSITERAAELEIDAPETDGKSNAELSEILKGLNAEATSRKDGKAARLAEGTAAEPEVEMFPCYVAEGKCLTTLRGMVVGSSKPNDPKAGLNVKDVNGGEKTLDALYEKGYIVKPDEE